MGIKNNKHNSVSDAIFTDDRLSFRAKGIFLYAMSRPDGWACNINDLVNHASDGRTSVSRGLEELQAYGYLIRSRIKGAHGMYIGYSYTFVENPQAVKGSDNK